VSTEDQSLERQMTSTQEYAEREFGADFGDLRIYRDESTGTDTERSGFRVGPPWKGPLPVASRGRGRAPVFPSFRRFYLFVSNGWTVAVPPEIIVWRGAVLVVDALLQAEPTAVGDQLLPVGHRRTSLPVRRSGST
jgi:hypothetical protein